ncbi:hypothetical protein BgiMline_006610, partial [Biomphalaria glabrata]
GIHFQLQCAKGKLMENHMCVGDPVYKCFRYYSNFGLQFKDENNNLYINPMKTDKVLKIILSQ